MRTKLWFGAAAAAFAFIGAAPLALAQDNDQPGDASTQARLTAGQPVEGDISPGDTDWYRLSVEQGQRYSLTLDGITGEDGATIDPMLGVYDGDGNQLAVNDDANGSLNSALAYTPAQSGEVFVEARGFSEEASGRYTLSVSAAPVPPDDVGNDSSTRARVRPGAAANGTIEYEGDADWYRLSARVGQSYHITLNGSDGDNGLQDPFLRVVDRDGAELAANDDSDGLNSALDFTPQASGDVFVVASGYGDGFAGGYALNVTAAQAPRDNTSANVSTRGRINIGASVDGHVDFAGDADWYRVRLEGGQSYRFTLAGSGASPLDDPLLMIHDSSGTELAMDDDGGGGLNSYLEFTAPSSGVYYVDAHGFNEGATGGYTLAALAGDIEDSPGTDVTLSAEGDYREGVLSPAGDHDWYRVELKEGQGMRVGMSSADGPDALGDPLVAIHGADGVEIVRDDDSGEGLNAWLEFIAPADGAYYINAQGFGEEATGRYVVTITPGEIGATPDSAENIAANGEPRISLINAPGDVDWYRVEMIEGRPYRFNVEGPDPGPVPNPVLTLYDSDGNAVASDTGGGTGANDYLTFMSANGGTYFAAVSGAGDATGRYSLRVSDTDVPASTNTDEFLDAAASDSRLSRIDMPGDLDTYRVELEAGARYTIEVKGSGDNPLADAFLTVLDGSGERVTSDDDSGDGLDARLRFTPSEAGTFFLQASGLGGSTGWYQISIVRQ